MHQVDDMKLTIHAQIENIYKDFLAFYRDLKGMVSQLKETRRLILESHPNNDYQQNSVSAVYSPKNNQNPNNISNLNFLQELSRD